jgi:hypothetical protein
MESWKLGKKKQGKEGIKNNKRKTGAKDEKVAFIHPVIYCSTS